MESKRKDRGRASAEYLRRQLNDAVILAPLRDTVTHKLVQPGGLVGVGATVATIRRLDKMYLIIYINEAELGKVKLGGAADIVINTYPNKCFRGTLPTSPIAEFTSKIDPRFFRSRGDSI